MQVGLFREIETIGHTFEEAAQVANVSTATIRNWVKTGYLIQSAKGIISKESLEDFMKYVAGTEKLNSRANKTQKDSHDHEKLTKDIELLINKYSGEKIGEEYEKSLSNSHRNKQGIYYTPSEIIVDMFSNIEIDARFQFLDPCCGSGNFIIEAIRKGIPPQNVYGFDMDENAVAITKERIRKEYGFDSPNIKVGDFLQEVSRLKKEGKYFDLIFTNPPWGKKIDRAYKEKYAEAFACGNSYDSSVLFLFASLGILKTNGFLGFLIQEAFFNITAYESVRNKILKLDVFRLIDYGKAFKGLLTRAQAIILKNTSRSVDKKIECRFDGITFDRKISSFEKNPKRIFNFWANEHDAQVIDRLYSSKHTTLTGKAKWALGIVTGNNGKYCKDKITDNHIPVYKGSDITRSGLKEATTYIPADFDRFQQVAPAEMYLAKEKLIYKFISSKLCFYFDDEKRYILNSANLLIPNNIDISPKQLAQLFNSEIMNWLFRKLFNTHKVLRSDLEQLPIHIDYFKNCFEFSEAGFLNYLDIVKTENGTFRVKK